MLPSLDAMPSSPCKKSKKINWFFPKILNPALHAKNLGYQLPTSQDIDNQKIYDESLIREEAQLAKLNQKQ